MGEHLKIILQRMFEQSGHIFSEKFTQKKNWFWKHTWTLAEEQEFIEWLTNYLYINSGARKELMGHSGKNKSICKAFARMFTFNYGWKTKEENELTR
jgi:hypothetical protein